MSLLFEPYFGENEGCRKTNITFRMLGDGIVPVDITKKMGINPSRAYAKGEVYKSKRVGDCAHPTGHWSVTSEGVIESTSTEKHAQYLLEQIEFKAKIIDEYINDPSVRVSVVFWWEATDEHGSFTLSSDTLGRLCRLCNDVDYHFIG